jgi:hypothetical protein
MLTLLIVFGSAPLSRSNRAISKLPSLEEKMSAVIPFYERHKQVRYYHRHITHTAFTIVSHIQARGSYIIINNLKPATQMHILVLLTINKHTFTEHGNNSSGQ